ncbi:hypothetical protein B7R78_0016300 [Ralstonia solanacearum]|uniref:Uncharacterized protein n=1 Tax=Ralstonia solanacearum K60 TaxID=1091042 RepID=A0AAP7ZPQ9_RALSL|nr:hypothetical protein [Ralstonia solanacearum]MBT1538612.1 hypothetical protein [Ralstonia solanacearum]OKA43546.1 hypothetical protein BH759_16540 [Ralstonia solanacearum]OYQ14500.1 hypothetical protein B7R77_15420 [Ralstonia solanacearum K60]QOK81873.1 hypothetical protein HF906_06705 [Ralstonia solanacearum]RIJ85701.1 hypothetical protein RSP822_14185 [Ralstonia solanacearum]
MPAAKNHDDGRLTTRRMLRVRVNAEDGTPALHLERLYENPGIREGDAVDRALVALAKAKADAMGCAPFKYVDAESGIRSREYEREANRIA